jgi:hypothetical protein
MSTLKTAMGVWHWRGAAPPEPPANTQEKESRRRETGDEAPSTKPSVQFTYQLG